MENQLRRFKMFFRFENEEAWLEEMSDQGWHLVKASNSFYTFEKGRPEQRTYKIDFRKFNHQQDLDDYITLFADSGWQCVNPCLSAFNHYFYTARDAVGADIFSDRISKAQLYLRYANYTMFSLVISFLPYLVLFTTGTFRVGDFGYKTLGLWSMKGSEFIFHFLFETPFVILRGAIGFLPILLFLILLFFYARYYMLYRQELVDENV